jgi:hypothetical protein
MNRLVAVVSIIAFDENVGGDCPGFNAPSHWNVRKRHIGRHSSAKFAFAIV